MAQSRTSSNASPGSSFASPDGPWATFLKHLAKHGNTRAGHLLESYRSDLWDAERVPVPEPRDQKKDLLGLPFAQIIDVLSDNAVEIRNTITYRQLHHLEKQSVEVDRFIDGLRTAEAGTSSRLVVLGSIRLDTFGALVTDNRNSCSYQEFLDAAKIYAAEEDLLIAHILAIEYDMDFLSVSRNLRHQAIAHEEDVRAFNGLGYTYREMIFYGPDREHLGSGKWRVGAQLMRVCALGRLQIKNETVDCSELSEDSDTRYSFATDRSDVIQFTPSPGRYSSFAYSIIADPDLSATKFSDPRQASGTERTRTDTDLIPAGEIIVALLRKGDWTRDKADTALRTHWLDAILRLLTSMAVDSLELTAHGPDALMMESSDEVIECRRTANVMHAAADQVEMFLEERSKSHRNDCVASLRVLRRLIKVADDLAQHLAGREEDKRFKKQMEMNELNITESRSAIGLTVIASIFVPISLASSIFGMNVQQINESGHSIWSFVVCAIVIGIVTALAWLSWQARRNWKVAKSRAVSNSIIRREGLTMRQALADVALEYPGYGKDSLPYWLGFRRLEKQGLSRV